MYGALYVVNLIAATAAGAVGSGFESENPIREAAFSYRERERRETLRDSQHRREQPERCHGSTKS